MTGLKTILGAAALAAGLFSLLLLNHNRSTKLLRHHLSVPFDETTLIAPQHFIPLICVIRDKNGP